MPFPTRWKKLRNRLETAAVTGAARFVPHLERRAVLGLAGALGALAYAIDGRGRRTAAANLRATIGGDWASSRVRETVRGSYRTLARTVLDLLWSPNLALGGWRRWLRIEALEGGPSDFRDVRQAIWVTPHFGNFDWLSLHFRYVGIPLAVVAQDFKNPALTPIVSGLRAVGGHAVIPREKAMLRLLRHLKRGGHAAFLTDLNVKPGKSATVIECFGLATCVTTLHAFLAERSGLPLIPGYSLPHDDGTYTTVVAAPIPTVGRPAREVCQAVWDVFEPVIRQHPQHWLWMYKHWRFLPPDTPAELYPPYANRSRKFDRLVARAGAPAVHGGL